MSGYVGAACCCNPEPFPCLGEPQCAVKAIVLEGTMSYSMSTGWHDITEREVLCGPECPGGNNNRNMGSYSQTWDRTAAESFQVGFKVLLTQDQPSPPPWPGSTSYSTNPSPSTYPNYIRSGSYDIEANSEYLIDNERTTCPPFVCEDLSWHDRFTQEMSGSASLQGQEPFNIELLVTRHVQYIDCDLEDVCLTSILIPGCYEVYSFSSAVSVDVTRHSVRQEYRSEEYFVQPSGPCADDVTDPPDVVTHSEGPESIWVRMATYKIIPEDEIDACPRNTRWPVDAMKWFATTPPGGNDCEVEPDCIDILTGDPGICCGLGHLGITEYAYEDFGGAIFPYQPGNNHTWVPNFNLCDNVAPNDGFETASHHNSVSADINCFGSPPSCAFAAGGYSGDSDPQPFLPGYIREQSHNSDLQNDAIYGVQITRKVLLYDLPDPALWPNGV